MKKTTTTPTSRPTQIIEVQTWKKRQGVCFRKIQKLGKFLIKLEIERDSYAFQSHAFVEVFNHDTLTWNRIYSIPYPHMKTDEGLCHSGPSLQLNASHFTQDSETLMIGATAILFSNE